MGLLLCFFPLVPFDSIFAISRLGRLVVVILVETASTRTFIRVKPFGGKKFLVEADFLETVASVKSRLLLD